MIWQGMFFTEETSLRREPKPYLSAGCTTWRLQEQQLWFPLPLSFASCLVPWGGGWQAAEKPKQFLGVMNGNLFHKAPSYGEIRHRTGECACNLIRKFLFSLWLYSSFSHLYDLFLLNQLARVLLVQVKGVCCAFLVEMQPTRITELSFVEHQQVPESGEEPEMPSYILFLTGSYKSECRAWEIERLVRKMLLSLLTATIPVSYSPALQMLVVSGILIISMGLHYYFMPYKVSWTVPLIECPIPPVLPFGFKPATIAFTARIELDFSQHDFGMEISSILALPQVHFPAFRRSVFFSIGAVGRSTFGTILNSASLPLHYC